MSNDPNQIPATRAEIHVFLGRQYALAAEVFAMQKVLSTALEVFVPAQAPTLYEEIRHVRDRFLAERLEDLERKHPGLAAQIDPRTIDEVSRYVAGEGG